MALVSVGQLGPQPLWRADLGDGGYRATFYNTTQPYKRTESRITGTSGTRLEPLKTDVEAKMRDDGLVPFSELPADVKAYWAEHDAAWLTYTILEHLSERAEDS